MQRKGLKISDEDGFVTKDFAEWYDNMRLVLFAVFALATAAEVFYWYRGAPSLPALAVLLIANFWGWLDAVLRYPAMHAFDSLFFVKQLLIGLAKLLWVIFLLIKTKSSPLFFIVLFLFNMLAPVFYLIVLPLDETVKDQRLAAAGVVNEDIAVRAARFLSNPRAWRLYLRRSMKRAQETFLDIVESSPRAGEALKQVASPHQARRLSGNKRCV
eukprot:TRINITY_DN39521_c0_g1_i2.p1 TRINITY_DN39521_c0_g1~~TRINITY_DN39521_c0_g1_i2.p1  ORF type:complete len:214 (+),score=27.77 TRINITY_DN39521_c0_g1_i2:99-740(+)